MKPTAVKKWFWRIALPAILLALFLLFLFFYYSVIETQGLRNHGEEIVEAIFRYKNRTGLWPIDIRDIESDPSRPLKKGIGDHLLPAGGLRVVGGSGEPPTILSTFGRWTYMWEEGRGFTLLANVVGKDLISHRCLIYSVRHLNGRVRMFFPKGFRGSEWAELQNNDEAIAQAIQQIDSRIKENLEQTIHMQGKISLLATRGDYETASQICSTYLESFSAPYHWWPHLCHFTIESQRREEAPSEAEMMKWFRETPPYKESYDILAKHQVEEIQESIISSVEDMCRSHEQEANWFGGSDAAAFFCFLFSLHCYREGQFEVSLALLDTAREYFSLQYLGMSAFTGQVAYAEIFPPAWKMLRAGCYIALGQWSEASSALKEPSEKHITTARWRKFEAEVSDALEAQDMQYRIPPNVLLEGINPYITYE